jgi:hypothetical protein
MTLYALDGSLQWNEGSLPRSTFTSSKPSLSLEFGERTSLFFSQTKISLFKQFFVLDLQLGMAVALFVRQHYQLRL